MTKWIGPFLTSLLLVGGTLYAQQSGGPNGPNVVATTITCNGSTGTTGQVLIGGSPCTWSSSPSLTGSVTAGTFFSGPGTVPASGDVRLQSGTTNGIWMKNGTNTTDIRVVAIDASSNVVLGNNQVNSFLPGAGGVNFGSGGSPFGSGFFGALTSSAVVTGTAFQTSTASVSLAGGNATPAFVANSVGAAGQPTTANQNSWIKANDSTGATVWIPVWK